VIEIFRGDFDRGFILPGISVSQGISAAMFVTAIAFLMRLRLHRI
jgi:hypothetical protein